jgi:hypothetical protein
MDDRPNKPSKRKLAKSAHPSQEEKEAMTATLEKARLKDERPMVQPIPLKPPPNFEPPVGDLGTPAPLHNDFSSNVAAASNVDPDGYDYWGRYGGYQATCFNSTLLDDRECDSRVEYIHHATQHVPSALGYATYLAPFSDPDAYGQGHYASSTAPPRESPAPRALDWMQQILEGIERATSASTLAIQSFVGQGELILVYLNLLKFLGFSDFRFTL